MEAAIGNFHIDVSVAVGFVRWRLHIVLWKDYA